MLAHMVKIAHYSLTMEDYSADWSKAVDCQNPILQYWDGFLPVEPPAAL
jgi:hypothetical protein